MAPLVFLLPVGHDQPVYDRPWMTLGLIATCTALFVVTATLDASAMSDLDAAVARLDAAAASDPNARATFPVDGLPELGPDEAYQLWMLPEAGTDPVSSGLVGADGVAFRLPPGAAGVALSREPATGSATPTEVVAVAAFS